MNTNLKEAQVGLEEDTEYSNKGNEWSDEYDKWVEDILKEEEEERKQ